MLIRFNVKNFLSFAEREDGRTEEFSMLAGKVQKKKEHIYDGGKIKLLKFAAIYGANASGKSNLVKAIDFMKETIINGLPKGHTEKYCRVKPENKSKESYFEFEIKLGEKYYSYGFEIILNESKFISEWLVELKSDNRENIIFYRDIQEKNYKFGDNFKEKKLKNKLEVYAEDIRNDSSVLFLSIMNENKKNLNEDYENISILKDIYLWIKDNLDINYPNRPISDYSYMANAKNVGEVCKIISAFGTGITDFKMINIPIEKIINQLPKSVKDKLINNIEEKIVELKQKNKKSKISFIMRSNKDFFILEINSNGDITCKTIQFSHEKNDVFFSLDEESDGTVRLLDLLEILLSDDKKTYIIDELDRCLHPSLSYKFIKTFLQKAEKFNIQLIVTTHESRLLDFDLLRRDEIWFVNKSSSGESDIYSLEEYNERFDKKIDKAYLEGRYGGVPIFSTVFPIEKED